jgi:hypothetical protein
MDEGECSPWATRAISALTSMIARGVMDPVSVHILDHTWTPLLTRTVTPSPGESGDTCQVLAFGEDTQLSEKR